jgi:cation diffusion facilitator family transporter
VTAGSESRRAIFASIGANALISITKFVVGGIARSTAMLAEAVHSLLNCFDGALLLLGQHRAKRPPDEAHPFGYGRELYFWSLIVAVVFFALGSGFMMYEGIRHVLHPQPLGDPKWSYIVLLASAAFDGASFVIGYRVFRKHARGRGNWRTIHESKNPAVFSLVLEDSADLVGLTFAFLGVFLSHALRKPSLDGVASIAISIVIGAVAIVLLVETHGLLIGEGAEPEITAAICDEALEESGVRAVTRTTTMHVGPEEIVVVLGLEFDTGLRAPDIAHRMSHIESRIRHRHPGVRRVYLEPSLSGRVDSPDGNGRRRS